MTGASSTLRLTGIIAMLRKSTGYLIPGRIARGRSNPQIGAELAISRRTVETHVSAIFNKLGLSSRAQIAAWAVRQLLVS